MNRQLNFVIIYGLIISMLIISVGVSWTVLNRQPVTIQQNIIHEDINTYFNNTDEIYDEIVGFNFSILITFEQGIYNISDTITTLPNRGFYILATNYSDYLSFLCFLDLPDLGNVVIIHHVSFEVNFIPTSTYYMLPHSREYFISEREYLLEILVTY